MQFTDDDSRDKFHKTTTLGQLVCAMLESFCMQHRKEPEIIDIERNNILVGVVDLPEEAAYDICDKVNAQFKRRDHRPTCVVTDPELGLFNLLVTETKDFRDLT